MKNLLYLMLFISMSCSAMRCGNVLVREGDYIDVMLTECGQADFVFKDVSVLGDRIVFIYTKDGRKNTVVTRDSKIEEIR